VIGLSVIQSLLLWQPLIILGFAVLVIVNYVAAKPPDMTLKDYFIAFLHILSCQFCTNYRWYIHEQNNINEENKNSSNKDIEILPTIKEEEGEEKKEESQEPKKCKNESVELSDLKITAPFTTTLKHSAPLTFQINANYQYKNKPRALSVESESNAHSAQSRELSINTLNAIHSTENTPTSESLQESRTRTRSRSSIKAAEPVAYRFINEFDTVYDENKFESLANALSAGDDNFNWKDFGIISPAPNSPGDASMHFPTIHHKEEKNKNEDENKPQ